MPKSLTIRLRRAAIPLFLKPELKNLNGLHLISLFRALMLARSRRLMAMQHFGRSLGTASVITGSTARCPPTPAANAFPL